MANEHQFSKEDVLTGEVTYPAPVFNLTGPQWQILNGINRTSLGLGAGLGLIFANAIALLAATADGKSLSREDWYKLAFSIVLFVLLWLAGYVSDRKRRRLVHKINQKLVSDNELGL